MKFNFCCSRGRIYKDDYRNFIILNRHCVFSLNFDHWTRRVVFKDRCGFNLSFDRLESIFLTDMPERPLETSLTTLRNLPRLFSLTISIHGQYYCCFSLLCHLVFSVSALKYNKILFLDYNVNSILRPIRIMKKFNTIEYLVIGYRCSLDQHTCLRCHIPQLCHLSCHRLVESDEKIKSEFPVKLSHLKYVSINLCQIEFNEFEEFIERIYSPLQVLRINISSNKNYLNAAR